MRGVSSYVAVATLLAVVVATSLVILVVTVNYSGIIKGEEAVLKNVVVIEDVYRGDPVLKLLVLRVRNVGSVPAVIDEALISTGGSVVKVGIGPYVVRADSEALIAVPTNLSDYEVFSIKVCGRGVESSVVTGLRLADLPTLMVMKWSKVVITERSGESLRNYVVNVTLTPSWSGWGYVLPNGSDIFFADSRGNPLYFWIERFDYGSRVGTIWVKVPYIPANSNVTIYMFYGYSRTLGRNPYGSYMNPYRTFIFFDSFEGRFEWVNWSLGIVYRINSLSHDGTYSLEKDVYCDPNGGYRELGKVLTGSFALEAWVMRLSKTPCWWDRVGVVDDSMNGYGIGVGVYAIPSATLGGVGPYVFIDKRTNSYGTIIASIDSVPGLGQGIWYFDRFIRLSNGTLIAEVYLSNGTKVAEVRTVDTTYTTFTRVYVFGGYPYVVDTIRIRPYTTPEPLVKVIS